MIFLDTSALVKAYVDELGSDVVRAMLKRGPGDLVVSDHVGLETLATFAYQRRDRRIPNSVYRRVRKEFFADYEQRLEVVPVTREIVRTAMRMANDHRKLGVGSIDLIHVATALHLRADHAPPSFTVACADRSMRLLAAAAGFRVFDPEKDDPARLDPHAAGLE